MEQRYFYGGNEALDSGLGSDDGSHDEADARRRAVENWIYGAENPFESRDWVTKQPVAPDALRIKLSFLDTGERLTGEHMQNAGRQVLGELYKLHTRNDPQGINELDMAEQVLPHLQRATGKDKVELEVKVVRVDLKDPTASFTGPMRNLEKFLPDSRRRFVNDALSHLEGLDQKKDRAQTISLALALAKAAKAGHLDERDRARLGVLSSESDCISTAFKVADFDPPLQRKCDLLGRARNRLAWRQANPLAVRPRRLEANCPQVRKSSLLLSTRTTRRNRFLKT